MQQQQILFQSMCERCYVNNDINNIQQYQIVIANLFYHHRLTRFEG